MSIPAAPSAEAAHAGLMDQVYRYQRYIYDFSRKYYLLGRDALIRELRLRPAESLVEIGCGTARNLIAIARAYPHARLFGLDASDEMLKTARARIAKAGLSDRITLVQGLAEELSPAAFGQKNFDRALFSYSLSMIPDWRQALRAAEKTLSEEGLIHIVDFGDLRTLPGRTLLKTWLGLFHVTPRVEFLAELEAELDGASAPSLLPGRYAFRFSGTKTTLGSVIMCPD